MSTKPISHIQELILTIIPQLNQLANETSIRKCLTKGSSISPSSVHEAIEDLLSKGLITPYDINGVPGRPPWQVFQTTPAAKGALADKRDIRLLFPKTYNLLRARNLA